MNRKRILCEKIINDSSVTRVNILNLKYRWTVENFPLWLKDNAQPLQSPIFPKNTTVTKTCTCSTWLLILDPKPDQYHYQDYNDYISLNIVYCDLDRRNAIKAEVELSILNDKLEKCCSHSFSQIFEAMKTKGRMPMYVRKDFLLNRENQLLTNEHNILTIVCELRVHEVKTHSSLGFGSLQTQCTLEPVWRTRILEGLGQLMSSQSFVDVTVKAQGQVISAHRAVLAAASPVFAAVMLEQARTKQPAFINLAEDIKHDVAAVELVRSMYTGVVQELHKRESMAFELLAAADKYQVEGLKLLCQQWLFERVTVNRAVDLLITADAQKASLLRQKLIKYIALHYLRIVDTMKFRELPASIATEIYVQIGRIS